MEGVVAIEDSLRCNMLCALEGCGCLDGLDVPAVSAVEGLDDHGGASLFALEAVTGDVWRGDKSLVEEFVVDIRFAFPAVERDVTVPSQQRLVVAHSSAGSVDDETASLEAIEELFVAEMPSGVFALMGEGCVESDYVACAHERMDRGE